MSDHVYKVLEIVGSSNEPIDDAIRGAIVKVNETVRNMNWFEVVETRRHIEDGAVVHFQVILKIGFTMD